MQTERSFGIFADMSDKPSPLRGDALRNKVLETALELFSEHGYFNTSIHDIRRAAGVSTGAIYHHFHNKEALAQSLYESLMQQMDEAIDSACIGKTSCLSQCRSIIEKLFQLTMDEPKTMQFVLMAKHREYLTNEAPICSSSPFQKMKQVVTEGMERGEVRQMEPWVAASAMYGGALRMMNLQLDVGMEKPLTDYLDEVVDCAWRGISA